LKNTIKTQLSPGSLNIHGIQSQKTRQKNGTTLTDTGAVAIATTQRRPSIKKSEGRIDLQEILFIGTIVN